MLRLTPTRNEAESVEHLGHLLRHPDPERFTSRIRYLHRRFRTYAATSPVPLPASGLVITPEVRTQCELYLPLCEVTEGFNHLYRSALTYPPILANTPFYRALSWADLYAGLPARFQIDPDPGLLLEALLDDQSLLQEFLFASFLPHRFYGGFNRYPEQREFIGEWLACHKRVGERPLRCLDAACGTGESTYGLAGLLPGSGAPSECSLLEGWTLEPLEVWTAAHGCFPHDPSREALFREVTRSCYEQGFDKAIRFCCVDILDPPEAEPFNLILCNGLLGGPIIHERRKMAAVVDNLAGLLAPGGVLLAADHFHGGWKQKCPQQELRALFELKGLHTIEVGEGIGGSALKTKTKI